MVEINIQATIGTCNNFMSDPKAKAAEISVVIAPLKVNGAEDGDRLQVISGCNMYQSCCNAQCWYSKAARDNKKGSRESQGAS